MKGTGVRGRVQSYQNSFSLFYLLLFYSYSLRKSKYFIYYFIFFITIYPKGINTGVSFSLFNCNSFSKSYKIYQNLYLIKYAEGPRVVEDIYLNIT